MRVDEGMASLSLQELKYQWVADPCWDIEDTEGFDWAREELIGFREQKEREWEQARLDRLRSLAERLGLPSNYPWLPQHDSWIRLAEYLEGLEARIKKLEGRDA